MLYFFLSGFDVVEDVTVVYSHKKKTRRLKEKHCDAIFKTLFHIQVTFVSSKLVVEIMRKIGRKKYDNIFEEK